MAKLEEVSGRARPKTPKGLKLIEATISEKDVPSYFMPASS